MTQFNHIEKRIQMSRLVEKINKYENYSRKLGLFDESQFHGKKISRIYMNEKEN